MSFDFDAGKYAFFVWTSYGATAVVVGWMIFDSFARSAKWRKRGRTPAGPEGRGQGKAMKRWLVFLPLAFLLGAIVLFGFYALGRSTRVEPNELVGKPLPKLAAPLLEGGPPVELASQVQGPAMVNLFASWCAPCIVGAAVAGRPEGAGRSHYRHRPEGRTGRRRPIPRRCGDPFAVVLDDRASVATIEFGATGIPETFVVDSKGIIVGKHTGPLETKEHVDALMAVLEKAESLG